MNSALLIIDVQKGFDEPVWGKRNNLNAEANIARLLQHWRSGNRPVLHVQHCSVDMNSALYEFNSGYAFKVEVQPLEHEPVFRKSVNSAFIGTNLGEYLYEQAIHSLVIVGLTTDHCVSTTVRMACNLGFNVLLVEDGCACFNRVGLRGKRYTAEQVHDIHLASLKNEFCTIQTTAEILSYQPNPIGRR